MSAHNRISITLLILLITIGFQTVSLAQNEEIIQLSGIVTDAQTKFPVPYATVVVPSDYRGVNASEDGFFSIVVKRSDTLQFSAIGYKPKLFIVPDSGEDNIESIAVKLQSDTLSLDPFVIYPWPSKEDFRESFLAYKAIQEYTMGPIPGIKRPDQIDTVPKAPTLIKNPISFIYEEVVKPIQWSKKKKHMVDELPVWKEE
ncbi:MAG: carboxypeptidase-like regulatory domain-containing protein [Bacteroidetes bacterium]|nr:carboxypeptidase-like regulatory domain-containing protein [Bacteroidota bacterium]MBK9504029.1 carboxypeptidase-like regulatory domain-containing protein [Bacteroidota bacterium]MBK9555751.1 carboxypeptidase-like regulatory domain-containing protein [Bacteroidota bacterium]MBL0280656.1 carboxypeptidase-like regulatory domain-containing protein [Bacteroidota bacterium]